jgi:hypothetical protein
MSGGEMFLGATAAGLLAGLVAEVVSDARWQLRGERRARLAAERARLAAERDRDDYAADLRLYQNREIDCRFLARCVQCGATFTNAIDGFAHMRSHDTPRSTP